MVLYKGILRKETKTKMEKKEIKKIKINEINLKNMNIETIKGLYFQYKEALNYLIFGALSTIVNFMSYYIFARIISIDEVISSALAWLCAVIFAYITNKIFVFESDTKTIKSFLKEMFSFFLARILSGITCDVGTFALMVKVLHINDIISKIITQVMVIIVNYVLSKFVVFKNKEKE